MGLDKSKASEVIGAAGVKYKIGEVRYNAVWEEMEFVSNGLEDGDAPIYRVKQKPVPVPKPEPEPIVEEKKEPVIEDRGLLKIPFDWNMKKDDIISALQGLGIKYNPNSTRSRLLNQLKEAKDRLNIEMV